MFRLSTRVPKALTILVGLTILAACAGIERQSKPAPVPEIHPGILAGYLDPETLPNSLALLPPPPTEGSAALALDEEVSRNSLALRGTLRWDLAAKDAELMFPEAAGTFSCALGIPITEQDTPHLYMLLRRTLADAGLSTYSAKNQYQRQRPFMVNKAPTCTPAEEAQKLGSKYDVCFYIFSSAATPEAKKTLDDIAVVNQCSRVVPFDAVCQLKGLFDRKGLDPELFGASGRKGV